METQNEAFFQSIVESIHSLVRLPVSLWVPNEDQKKLYIQAAIGLPKAYTKEAILNLTEPSIVSDVFQRKIEVIVDDIQTNKHWKYKRAALENGWQAALCVPIKVFDKAFGVISIYAYRSRELNGLKLRINDYARQIALTLEAENRNNTIERLLDIGNKFEQLITKTPKQVLQEITKSACEVTGADCAVIYPYDAERKEFFDISNVTSHNLKQNLKLSDRPRTNKGMAAFITREGEVIRNDIEKQEPEMFESPFIKRESIKAFMGIALQMGNDYMGVLYINFRTPHEFSDIEKDTIRLFARQASIAVYNSRLFQHTNTQSNALEKLQQASTKLISISGLEDDLRNVLKEIATNAQQILNAELVDLYEYIESRDTYRLPPIQVGERNEVAIPKDKVHKDDVIWKIVRSKTSLYEKESQKAAPLIAPFQRKNAPKERFVFREDIQSTAGIPLLLGGEVLGVLFANYKRPQTFSNRQRKLIELFASQAANVISNARRIRTLRVLENFGRDLISSIELDEANILKVIHTNAKELMDTDNMYIALYDDDTNVVRFKLAYVDGVKIDTKVNPTWYPRQGGIGRSEEIIRTKKPLLIKTRSESKALYEKIGRKNYAKDPFASYLGVPMRIGEKIVGVIANYHRDREYAYKEENQTVLQALANQAAIAIENANLFNDVNRRREALVQFGQVITDVHRSETEILDLVHEQTEKLMDTSNMYVALYKEDTDMVRFGLAYMNGERQEVLTDPKWKPRKAGKGRTEEIIFSKSPILITHLEEAEAWYNHPDRKEYIGTVTPSWIGVPMKIREKVDEKIAEKIIGVIAAYHETEEYVYDGDDRDILQALANQTAIALTNSSLYRQTEKQRKNLQVVSEIVKTVSSDLEPDTVMNHILTETISLFGAHYATIQLVNEASSTLSIRARKIADNKDLNDSLQEIPVGTGITGTAAKEKRTIRVGDVHNDVDFYLNYISDTISEMATPLIEKDKVVGVLNIEDSRSNAFDEDDQALFELLAEEVVIVIQNARHIEARREEEKRQADAGRMEYLGLLAGGVAHRVGSKSGLIRLDIKELETLVTPDNQQAVDALKRIDNANQYLIELSDMLFKPANAADMPLRPIDVNQLLRDAVRKANIPKSIDFSLHEGDVPLVMGNHWLVEVFSEIIFNAIKHLPQKGLQKINVRTKMHDKNNASIIFEDTGVGLSPDEYKKVFELFYTQRKASQPPSSMTNGGFGLWFCKSVVVGMGGDILVKSKEGKGSTFTVLLPLAPFKGGIQ